VSGPLSPATSPVAPSSAVDPAAGKRPLGSAHATALVIANMVGTGVFTTTGVLLPTLGSAGAVLAVWAVSGLLALCGAAVYAELGTMMPEAGGEYVYLSRALHPAAGFLAGWVGILVGFATPTGAAALAFARYLHVAAPGMPQTPVAIVLVVALTVVHMTHVRFGAHLQTAVTGLVVALILFFVVGAAVSGRGDWAHVTQSLAAGPSAAPAPKVGAFAVGLVTVGYAYLGWNAVSYVAGEVRDPSRVLPSALVAGTATVTVLYLALNFVFLWSVPPQALAGKIEVASVAAQALFGPRGAPLLSILVAFAVAGCASAMIVAGSRITVAMADDGVFFRALGRRGRHGAPFAAVALQGAIAAAAALTTAFDRILVFVGFTLNLTAGAAVAAAFVLRRRQPLAARPYRALGWPVSGFLFLALVAGMTVFAIRDRPFESAAGLGTLAAGGVAYAIWQRRRGEPTPRVLR
jgi:APA family basic amino acid/polyamine antiporter